MSILYHSKKPSLAFSICFLVLYTVTSLLHLSKLIKFKRTVYVYLFTFSLLRICLFAFRIAWSQNLGSEILGILSNILLSGGFFVLIEALLTLLSDWLIIMTGTLPIYEHYLIKSLKLLSPSFSIIGVLGEILEYIKLVSLLRQISSLGFLCLIIVYIILVTFFALKYGEKSIRKQLKALVLFISSALILIELVYRTFISFINESKAIDNYEWAFYVFECMPEIILLVTLGGVILGEWFYHVEDDNEQLAKSQAKEEFNTSILLKK